MKVNQRSSHRDVRLSDPSVTLDHMDMKNLLEKVGAHLDAVNQTPIAERFAQLRERCGFDSCTGSIFGTLVGHATDSDASRDDVLEFAALIYDFTMAARRQIEP